MEYYSRFCKAKQTWDGRRLASSHTPSCATEPISEHGRLARAYPVIAPATILLPVHFTILPVVDSP